jgi:ferredoxin-NADP reductase
MEPIETTVAAVHDVGPDAVAIDLDTPAAFDAEPGQFVKLTATIDGESEARFYTVSSPDTDDTFEFTISYDPEEGGAFSEYLLALETGDTVTITGPFGDDYYENEARAVVLAGGPGIGPAVAIAERALAEGNEAAVVYRDDNPLHEDRLSNIANAGASVFVLSESESLTDAVADVLTNDDDEQVFVYGFAAFLEDATDAIEAADGSPDDAKAENFG